MKYLVGKPQDFFSFVDSIGKGESVGIFSHNDLDGLASVFFIEKILELKGIKLDFINFISWTNDSVGKILSDLRKIRSNKIILLDLNLEQYPEYFEKIRKKHEVFLIDHHKINSSLEDTSQIIKTGVDDCCAMICYDLAKKYFEVSEYDWLVCAAMVSDFSWKDPRNAQFIKERFKDFDVKNFQESEPGRISNYIGAAIIYFDRNVGKIYSLIKEKNLEEFKMFDIEIKKEVNRIKKEFLDYAEYFEEKNMYFYYFNSKFRITSLVATVLSNDYKDKILIFVTDDPNDRNYVKISARNQNANWDMVEVLQNAMNGFSYGVSGGHKPAAGGHIMKKDLEKFKANLLKS